MDQSLDQRFAPRVVHVGAATVTVVTCGVGRWVMAASMTTPTGVWRPENLALLDQPAPAPFQCVHIAIGDASVVVDTMDLAEYLTAHGWPVRSSHVLTPRLDTQLTALGVATSAVTQVILTHAHDDHFNVTTVADAGAARHEPLFPAAIYSAGLADWTPEGQRAIHDAQPEDERLPDGPERYMGELLRRGMVSLLADDSDIAPGVRLLRAPGETPGHVIVRVHSGGQTLYCLGDLFHHPFEVEHPEWMPVWAEPKSNLESRAALVAAALAEDALLVAAHIPGVGRLRRAADGARWEPVL